MLEPCLPFAVFHRVILLGTARPTSADAHRIMKSAGKRETPGSIAPNAGWRLVFFVIAV
jgi:hypothetical protein